jgi:hypothetical protein
MYQIIETYDVQVDDRQWNGKSYAGEATGFRRFEPRERVVVELESHEDAVLECQRLRRLGSTVRIART